uniref:Uncharacterized protein n=1 Tax=Hemiselmis tepida TaxID=464990 RepID=A0A7S0Z189_9CRYP|mmetsp:Transcript_36694/g.93756  ORF Transcript_36694/g.93756 Transcript_36694/m.93756 type:complete len:140 (+) Transcript_36694:252-671(+)
MGCGASSAAPEQLKGEASTIGTVSTSTHTWPADQGPIEDGWPAGPPPLEEEQQCDEQWINAYGIPDAESSSIDYYQQQSMMSVIRETSRENSICWSTNDLGVERIVERAASSCSKKGRNSPVRQGKGSRSRSPMRSGRA